MNIKVQKMFVSFEIALSLKEKGFDEPCLGEFHNGNVLYPSCGEPSTNSELKEVYEDDVIGAPTHQQVIDWLREEKKLTFTTIRDGGWWSVSVYNFEDEDNSSPMNHRVVNESGDDYYKTLEKAILETLKLIK